MDFYKSILILAVLSLIIILSIFGVILSNMSKKQIYPANISKCPDYYSLVSGTCVSNETIYSKSNELSCSNFDYEKEEYNVSGMGPSSGLCLKKKWANDCGVSWDGITNNSNICY
jgi:hypothetical protein